MTLLTAWPDTDSSQVLIRTEDAEEIKGELKQLGVRFDRWPVVDLPAEPTSDEVLAVYREYVDRVNESEGYTYVDALHMTPQNTPEWAESAAQARQKFLAEHTHDDDEDRFFARGAGVFYLHVDAKVYGILCEAGDLLSVPANTTHWFDMGTRPDYVAIRFFHDDGGWVGNFTGNTLANDFPSFDELTANR
ncbi:1,2-dihydroxy-3-keto-5-methylthiopentene dioxygenase [Kibdelosporangium phytohabitans]|uniref:Acireductone dioxygenase n=1 Tax=Kibdelosporangium phytohabitans TaxID=860235 RepID=A0A0N9IF84_9PSEU|nr:cupin [Kibdelosporangium phytohabitans]ALG13488.1 cupin [Kibdelosporangium phytohabitans]MBE1465337.1 1,2-dihydroxy-3-keto-5-methylthiopentene dioxygenase [Kibdelosporangium phytohabitans]